MPILKNWERRLLVLVALASLTGCDRGSPAYRHIKDLPYSQWDRYATSLPLEQRLDLHKEIMEQSGHNPQMTIEASFSAQPTETYKSVINRIRHGDKSRYYLGIIYEINRSPGFKVCSQPDRAVVQSYLSGIEGYPGQAQHQPEFYSC
jgi:hypothetical protein